MSLKLYQVQRGGALRRPGLPASGDAGPDALASVRRRLQPVAPRPERKRVEVRRAELRPVVLPPVLWPLVVLSPAWRQRVFRPWQCRQPVSRLPVSRQSVSRRAVSRRAVSRRRIWRRAVERPWRPLWRLRVRHGRCGFSQWAQRAPRRAFPAFPFGWRRFRGRGRLFFSRLFGGLFGFFLRLGVPYRGRSVFAIACQSSLTPRPPMAENGNGSTPSLRMARKPCSCSDWFNLSIFVATTRYGLPRYSSHRFRSRSFSIHPRRVSRIRQESFRVSLFSR